MRQHNITHQAQEHGWTRRLSKRLYPRALLLAVLSLGVLGVVPTPAKADSCLPLLYALYDHVANRHGFVEFRHTTNYLAYGYWATAQGSGRLTFITGNGLMSGTDYRIWSDGHTDNFELYFAQNGTVWFGPYGPYTPACYGNKFLVVNAGDSYETLTFLSRSY